MNLEYLTDEQVMEFCEMGEEATRSSAGWSMSQTEHMRFLLRNLGIHDIPTDLYEIVSSLRREKKDREF